MQQETSDELTRIQAHHLLAIAISRVAHTAAIHAEDALIGGRRERAEAKTQPQENRLRAHQERADAVADANMTHVPTLG